MREAAKYFVGKHDFTSFANASRNDRTINPVKEIFRFDVVEQVISKHLNPTLLLFFAFFLIKNFLTITLFYLK